jgi:hypothetical protein
VALLALAVGEPSERERVGTGEQPHAVVERQPLARVQFVGDIAEPCAFDSLQHDSLV